MPNCKEDEIEQRNAVKGKENVLSRDRTLANSKLLCCDSSHRVAVLQMTTVCTFLGAS